MFERLFAAAAAAALEGLKAQQNAKQGEEMWALDFSPGCEKAEHVHAHVCVLCMGGRGGGLAPLLTEKENAMC